MLSTTPHCNCPDVRRTFWEPSTFKHHRRIVAMQQTNATCCQYICLHNLLMPASWWQRLAIPSDNPLLVLDPQVACICSSLNGPKSSYSKSEPTAHATLCRQHSSRQDFGCISYLQFYLNTNLLIFHKPVEIMSLQARETV